MKLFLLNPPYKRHFIRSARWTTVSISGSNWYPIWLAYCASLLEKKGHSIKLLDAQADGLSIEETLNIIKGFSPRILVVYPSIESLKTDIELVDGVKAILKEVLVVFVGPWASAYSHEMLEFYNVDTLAVGEFDYTILELAEEKDFDQIRGLYWKRGERLYRNQPRKPVSESDLEEFGFVIDVYRRHLKVKNYFQAPHLYPFVDLFTGRGCYWAKCNFCIWPYTMNKGAPYRKRNISSVIEELYFIKKYMPYVKEVFFQDDTLPPDRAFEISEEILRSNLKIVWSCYTRVDMDYATLKIMRRAGCRSLHVGYESYDSEVLRLCNKGTTVKMAEDFTENAVRCGFLIHADFILGLPGETIQTIKNTIGWAKRLPLHSYQFTTVKVYKATPLYSYLERTGALKGTEVDYPSLSNQWLKRLTKKAIRECNFNLSYIFRMLRFPKEFFRLFRAARFVFYNVFLR